MPILLKKTKRRNNTVSQCGLHPRILFYFEIHFGQVRFGTEQYPTQSEKTIAKQGRNRYGGKRFVSACHY